MEYMYNVKIKEEKLSDDEDTSTIYEDEEKLFMDAPIKFEYPEDDNFEHICRETVPDVRKRPSETSSSELPATKKQKSRDDRSQLEKNVENKTCCSKTDNGSQTLFCENSDFLKAAAKPINVACQTQASPERAEVACQTEGLRRATAIIVKKEVSTEVESTGATNSTTPPRTVNGQSAAGSSCTDHEKLKKKVTDPPILPQDMLNGIEKSPTTKDVAITLSLALCKGLIQALKPRAVPKSILHDLSREVVTSVRDALSKIPGSPETVPSAVKSPAKSPSAKTQEAPESKFLPVKLPDASRSCLKSPDETRTGSPRSDEEKSTPKPLEPLPKAVPSGGVKEEPEEQESSELAYSESFCNGNILIYRCWNCSAYFARKKALRKHYLYFCTKGSQQDKDESCLDEHNYYYWCDVCATHHKCYHYPELTDPDLVVL